MILGLHAATACLPAYPPRRLALSNGHHAPFLSSAVPSSPCSVLLFVYPVSLCYSSSVPDERSAPLPCAALRRPRSRALTPSPEPVLEMQARSELR